MNRLFYILFGIFFIGFAAYSLYSGEVVGLGSINSPNRTITVQDDFIEYCLMVLLDLSIGVVLIKKTLFEDKDRSKKGKEK